MIPFSPASDQLIEYNNNSRQKCITRPVFTRGFSLKLVLCQRNYFLGGFSIVVFVLFITVTQWCLCVILSKDWGELERMEQDVPGLASEFPSPPPTSSLGRPCSVGPGQNSEMGRDRTGNCIPAQIVPTGHKSWRNKSYWMGFIIGTYLQSIYITFHYLLGISI